MKIYKDIIQGTEEWHRIKYGKIGGSTSKGLFVESDTLLYEIAAQHLEPFELEEDGFINSDMQRGLELQPMAIEATAAYIGVPLIEVGWMESIDIPLIGISPDAISEDATISAEVKCPAKTKHTKTLMINDIPADNIHQCLHYFTVNPNLETHYFVSYRPESKHPLFIKKLTRDSMVDLGTKAKPNFKPVSEWVRIAKGAAMTLEANLIIALNNLEKI